jgi:undecaprenyl diphosphate synthase
MEGARAGAETVHKSVAYLIKSGLKYLTVWAFSSDNAKRPPDQVRLLFEVAQAWLERDSDWLNKQGVRLRHIGRTDRLPQSLYKAICSSQELTKRNTGMTLFMALDYCGRSELIEAIRGMIKASVLPEAVNADLVNQYLSTEGAPDVDLIIRTGGELRISNFMIWQAAYSEYYFTPILWPDFDEKELQLALESYSKRHRRFGGD